MIDVGVFGSTGYTGAELIRLLTRHEQVRLRFATSASQAGQPLARVFPGAPAVELISPAEAPLGDIDVAFLCLPHSQSAEVAVDALQAGSRVIDLSADFRLRDPDTYQQWYGVPHPAPELLSEAVYGLTEIARNELPEARLVANPGCYPTTVLLGLYPLMINKVVSGTVIVDAKSGVSGAGRKPKLGTHFVEVADNLKPYNIGRSHRHLPEMEQILSRWSEDSPKLIFSPHLLPVSRGLLSTIYVPTNSRRTLDELHELFRVSYADEPFIEIMPVGEPATLSHVNNSNRCAIGLAYAEGFAIITVAIDNLLKGASGQAVQNMNIMFGVDETTGLL